MIRDYMPLTKAMDEGLKNEISKDFHEWNTRTGERYPLSPSTIGRCALKLARDVAHFHGLRDFPRGEESRSPRLQRIFRRGDLLESAIIQDFNELTPLRVELQQEEVFLFNLIADKGDHGTVARIKGNIDGLALDTRNGVRVLFDCKSKGAFYSAYGNSVDEMVTKLVASGLAEEHRQGHNCYIIPNIFNFFERWPLDDMLAWYVLQLNAYACALPDHHKPHFVALFYENKNTCDQYEIRWEPDSRLFEYAREKFQYIFEVVHSRGPEAVPREYVAGSSQCRLCEYNEMCNPMPEKKDKSAPKWTGVCPESMDKVFTRAIELEVAMKRAEQEILTHMERNNLDVIQLSNGLRYERKHLKSPKPHWELRVTTR